MRRVEVVIVGGGVAGLVAAKTLTEGGVNDYIILEAQDRLGGRINTVEHGDHVLEIGAQWIHGEDNRLYKFAKENNLTCDAESYEAQGVFFTGEGKTVPEEIIEEIRSCYDDWYDSCNDFARTTTAGTPPPSVGDYFKQRFEEHLETNCQGGDNQLRRAVFEYFMKFELIDNSCESLFDLSCLSWGEYYDCIGNRYVNLKDGYGSVVSTILKSIPDTNIRLNSPVTTIQWTPQVSNDDLHEYDVQKILENLNLQETGKEKEAGKQNCGRKLVKVKLQDGTEYQADHVIYTPSIGYTRRHYSTLFQPALPQKQTQALQKLNFGVVDKIFLEYEEPWWEAGCKGIHMVWPDEEMKLPTLPDKPDDKMWHQWYKAISGFDTMTLQPNFLLGWLCADNARYMETLTPDTVGDVCTHLLRYFSGNPDIPPPKNVYRSAWHSNPYICGSYSYRSNVCDQIQCTANDLAQPVYTKIQNGQHELQEHEVPVLQIAGEGTNMKHYSTVHGAYHSGYDAATLYLSWCQ